jgi:hypothetical protein
VTRWLAVATAVLALASSASWIFLDNTDCAGFDFNRATRTVVDVGCHHNDYYRVQIILTVAFVVSLILFLARFASRFARPS